MKTDFDLCRLQERNDKIIRAVIAKAEQTCPGALDLIGIYGSFMTGDVYEKSDLDLMILVNDERGFALSSGFLQEDEGIGYDLYCTTWDRLEADAAFTHPHISKLMDSVIVWCPDNAARERLESLRQSVREMLDTPLSAEELGRAEDCLAEAERFYAKAMCAETLPDIRRQAVNVLYALPDALMLLNKQYYRRGVRRLTDELELLEKRPAALCERMEAAAAAGTSEALKSALTSLLRETEAVFDDVKRELAPPKQPVTRETLAGTYEEMFSNWRNKMELAAGTGNRLLSFATLGSLQSMLDDIADGTEIAAYDAVSGYDPDNLWKNAESFDRTLECYLTEYRKAGLDVKRYADVDAFTEDYLK